MQQPAPASLSMAERHSAAFVCRCNAYPSHCYPGHAALYRAMGMSAAEFRKCLAGRACFTPAQLEAGNQVLAKASPFNTPGRAV